MDVDSVYVDSKTGGDAVYAGLSSVQRIRSLNTAVRIAGSLPTAGETPQVGRGALLFSEISWTPPDVRDLLYANGFFGLGQFTSAARGPDAGGPLGRTGILFSAHGIGTLAPPLGNYVEDAAGGAIGYQAFLGSARRQLILELGGRSGTRRGGTWQLAAGVRFQQALFQRHVFQLDAAVSESPDTPVTPTLRAEWRIRF